MSANRPGDWTGVAGQLRAVRWLHETLTARGIDYWIFGGWAVDLHAGRVTREHSDVDLAIWASDLEQFTADLAADGWGHAPEPGEDGYTGYERAGVRIEIAFLARDGAGVVHTPLREGRGEWPAGSFGEAIGEVGDVQARVVNLTSLIEDKSSLRDDPDAAAKDRADVALLTSLRRLERRPHSP